MTDTPEDIMEDPARGMQVSRGSLAMGHPGILAPSVPGRARGGSRRIRISNIGVPGKQDPGQTSPGIIKQRRFRLEQPLTDEEAAIPVKALGVMLGIMSMEITGDAICITHDLLRPASFADFLRCPASSNSARKGREVRTHSAASTLMCAAALRPRELRS